MRPEHDRARQMRSAMSEPEVILWSRLKRLRERGFHIRRQAPFKGYYLDFVCYARRVVIEVDGYQHGEDRQADHDAVRDRVLERHGFRVLRVWASDVRYELDWVMDQIVGTLEAASMTEGARRAAQRLAHTSPP
ncbi:endonuclease domain-containing protein [Phenylobacterium sp.]|uniref:endonuclease domain-containing protein n=1 Tax=Phenylobacterium sp. TaxID=1871053 RepID=UPI003D2C9DF4